VGFAEDLELWIGIEDSLKMYKLNVPLEVGATGTTPWSCPDSFSESAQRDQRFVAHSSPEGRTEFRRLPSRPTWANGIEAILNTDGHVDEQEEDMVVYVTSYFISHRDLPYHDEPRVLRFDREVEEWEREVRFMWEDLIDHDAPLDVVIVRPDPPRSIYPGTVATVIVHQHFRFDRAACLISTAHIMDPDTRFSVSAHSTEPHLLPHRIRQLAGVEQTCQQRVLQGAGQCEIYIGHQQQPEDNAIAIFHGLGLLVRVPSLLSEEEIEQNLVRRIQEQRRQRIGNSWDPDDDDVHPEDARPPHRHQDAGNGDHGPEDAVSFMARNEVNWRRTSQIASSSSTPSSPPSSFIPEDIRRTVVFTLDGRAFPTSLPWDDVEQHHTIVARDGGMRENQIAQLWQVSNRPSDLTRLNLQCFIVQLRNEPRPAEFMKIILIDIDIYNTQSPQPFAMRRQAKWLPRVVNRRSVFRLLGLDEQYQEQEDHCYLWHNHVTIEVDQTDPLRLEDGDFLLVHIGEHISSLSCGSAPPETLNDSSNASWNPADVRNEEDQMDLFQRSLVQSSNLWQGLHRQLQQIQLRIAPEHQRQPASLSNLNSNPQAAPRQQRSVRFHSEDLRKFGRLFEQQALIECEEEGAIAYLETWMIHHQHHRSCTTSRAVRIQAVATSWIDDIIEPWEEELDPDLDVIIHLVNPQPPCTNMECVMAHLIIEQSQRQEHTVGLISVVRHRHRQQSISHAAHSLPDLMSRHYVLRMSDVLHECHPTACQVRQGPFPFGLVDMEEIPRAVGLVIEIRRFDARQDVQGDGLELMQRTTTRWQRRAQVPQDGSEASSTGGSCEGFSFNPDAPTFVPQIPSMNTVPEAIEDLHQHWQQHAFTWEGETASSTVMTWFVDHYHPGQQICLQPRAVRLFEDFSRWEQQLRNAWQDRALPGAPIMIHVVEPAPPQVHPEIAIHVLLVQNPQDTLSTIVLTGIDNTDHRQVLFTQLALTVRDNFVLDQVLMLIGLGQHCLATGTQFICVAWYGNTAIPLGTLFPIRDGYGIILRVEYRPVQHLPVDGNVLLQTALRNTQEHMPPQEQRIRTCERLTAATVTHEQRPQDSENDEDHKHQCGTRRTTICLEDLVEIETAQEAITLWYEHATALQPPFIVVDVNASEQDVSLALEEWNLANNFAYIPSHQIVAILDPDQKEHLWIYLPDDPTQRTDQIMMRAGHHMTTHQHMRFLYTQGFYKAVVVSSAQIQAQVTKVTFKNVIALPPTQEIKTKERTPWPEKQTPQSDHRPIFDRHAVEDRVPTARLTYGLSIEEFEAFFHPEHHPLHHDLSGFELPDSCRTLIDNCVTHQHIDRLLIYADGSSQSRYKRKPPLWIEEHDICDSWCFAVFGENYASDKLMSLDCSVNQFYMMKQQLTI